MRKAVRYFLYVVVAASVVLAITASAVSSATYGALLASQIEASVDPKEVRLALEDPRAHIWGVKSSKVDVFFPKILSSVTLTDVHLYPAQPLQWLLLRPTFRIEAAAYEGILSGVASFYRGGSVATGFLKVSSLQLWRHPFLAAFGFNAGTLDIDIDSFAVKSNGSAVAEGTLGITDLQSASELTVPPLLVAVAAQKSRMDPAAISFITQNLHIPQVRDLDANVPFTVHEDEQKADFVVVSGLGGLKGRYINNATSDRVFNSEVSLTEEGAKKLGPLISLASNGALTAQVQRFTMRSERGRAAQFTAQ